MSRPSLSRVPTEDDAHDEVFEIQDFTNATNWEKFISLIEETIRSWNLTSTSTTTTTQSQQLTYAGRAFILQVHHVTMEQHHATSTSSPSPTPPRSDHTWSTHSLHQWFGVTSFLLLQPVIERRISSDESRLLLSTLMVAVENCQCPLPVFVPIDDTYRHHYIGRCMTMGHHITYDTRSCQEIPPGGRHLSGLTEWFQEKTKGKDGSSSSRPLIAASYSYTQSTQDWDYQQDHDETCVWRDTSYDILSWGPHQDPLAKIILRTAWPYFPEGTFVDNAVYSDLDPLSAPNWIISIEWSQRDEISTSTDTSSSHDTHPLTSTVIHMHSLINDATHTTSMANIVGSWEQEQNRAATALAAMTVQDQNRSLLKRTIDSTVSGLKQHIADAEREAMVGAAVTREWCQQKVDEMWEEKETKTSLPDILPETSSQLIRNSSGKRAPRKNSRLSQGSIDIDTTSTSTSPSTSTTTSTSTTSTPLDPPRAVIPYGSLLSTLVIHLCSQHPHLLTLHTVALLWSTFITRIRQSWDTYTSIPHLMSSDVPDFGYVLIHQKLQLLQRCIRMAQQAKNMGTSTSTSTSTRYDAVSSHDMTPIKEKIKDTSTTTPNWHAWNQAWESESEGDEAGTSDAGGGWGDLDIDVPSVSSPSKSAAPSGWDIDVELDAEYDREQAKRTPEGVAGVVPGLNLLLTDLPMNLPIVQEHTVMTQDQFEEHQELFARLGSSEEATKLRAELQGASLLSDMQSFRAANPGCILEDFVRWHSPADWKPDPTHTSKRGMLSQRMRSSTNIWQRLWRQAKPCPAYKQKPLFDYQSCAERILNYFETLEPTSLLHQLTSIAYTNALCILARTDGAREDVEYVKERLKETHKYVGIQNVTDAFYVLRRAEQACARAASLLYCFPFSTRIVNELMHSSRSLATNRRERHEILEIFAEPNVDVDLDGEREPPKHNSAISRKLSAPECVEFTILKPTVSGSSSISGCGPRLYARISQPLFRVATTWHVPHS